MSGLKQLPEEDSGQSEVTHLAVARRQLYRNGIPGPLIGFGLTVNAMAS